MTTAATHPPSQSTGRIDWVDYGKGICIILVVMMHSTNGVERVLAEVSWLNGFIAWARPFRMPDFFLISGLFLAARIDRPWRSYLDTKVVHFAYFYVLWMTILFVLKGGLLAGAGGASLYLMNFVEPAGSLWFIYMLAIFFVVTKLMRPLPVALVWLGAAALHSLNIHTGWTLVDEFAGRFVYFYTGFVAAPLVFRFAEHAAETRGSTLYAALVIWAVINAWMVESGLATAFGLSLIMGFAGCAAVVAVAVICTQFNAARIVRYCGEHSIVIYLAFAAFMGSTRLVLVKLFPDLDAGVMSLIVTAAAVGGPLILHLIVRKTPLAFLFARPALFRLKPRQAPEQPINCVPGRSA